MLGFGQDLARRSMLRAQLEVHIEIILTEMQACPTVHGIPLASIHVHTTSFLNILCVQNTAIAAMRKMQ